MSKVSFVVNPLYSKLISSEQERAIKGVSNVGYSASALEYLYLHNQTTLAAAFGGTVAQAQVQKCDVKCAGTPKGDIKSVLRPTLSLKARKSPPSIKCC